MWTQQRALTTTRARSVLECPRSGAATSAKWPSAPHSHWRTPLSPLPPVMTFVAGLQLEEEQAVPLGTPARQRA